MAAEWVAERGAVSVGQLDKDLEFWSLGLKVPN